MKNAREMSPRIKRTKETTMGKKRLMSAKNPERIALAPHAIALTAAVTPMTHPCFAGPTSEEKRLMELA